ncbi:F-box/LRR-repeat protein At3g59190-like [Rutidosis leptorrhynchoides]|uniref:F-box/LRR-repeat protein At3g59190-like n=1 Tax=Rutidosis leptorrhynchoides TaxID=125765 RepID=UPI003A99FE39
MELNGKDDHSDRSLSDLPDGILEHILSYLPTKIAVRTSVLSRRWEFLWTSLKNLEFYEHHIFNVCGVPCIPEVGRRNRKLFMDFVDRVLLLNDVRRLEKFSLACKVKDDVSRIETWMLAAIRRNPKELLIGFHAREELERDEVLTVPHSWFSYEELEVLKVDIGPGFHLPFPNSQFRLPNLKRTSS